MEGDNWCSWIPYYTFAYNITPHVDTNYSPFELVFGKLPSLPGDNIVNDTQKIYDFENYANELRVRLKYSLENARKIIEKVKLKRREDSYKNSNNIELEVGDLVLMKIVNRKKNQPPYKGPYGIISIDNLNVTIQIEEKTKTVHKNLLKKYICKHQEKQNINST